MASRVDRADDVRHRAPVIVAPPVGVDHVLAMGPAPRLAAVDIGRDGDTAVLRHDAGIGPAERAIEKAGVIGDVVHRGEKHGAGTSCLAMMARRALIRRPYSAAEKGSGAFEPFSTRKEFRTDLRCQHCCSPKRAGSGAANPVNIRAYRTMKSPHQHAVMTCAHVQRRHRCERFSHSRNRHITQVKGTPIRGHRSTVANSFSAITPTRRSTASQASRIMSSPGSGGRRSAR